MNTLLDSLVDEMIKRNVSLSVTDVYARCFVWRVIYHLNPKVFKPIYPNSYHIPESFTYELYSSLGGER